MTYTNQPVVNVFQYTIAEEEAMEALSAEAEAYYGDFAYYGESCDLIPADLVKDADFGTSLVLGPGWARLIPGQYSTPWEA